VWVPSERKWQAAIKAGGTKQFIGMLEDEREAAIFYDRAARALHGASAELNFPEGASAPATVNELRREIRARYKEKTTSSFRGVSWSARAESWLVQITAGQVHTVGYFENEHEAAHAYDRAATTLHGEAAVLNFPETGDKHRPSRR
jgi:hypothetical protein